MKNKSMKQSTALLFYIIILPFISCGQIQKNEKGENRVNEPIISNNLYLSLDSISNGESWLENNDKQFFYRILLSSIEESKYVYVELIEILEEGSLQFIKRDEIVPEMFGFDYYSYSPEIIKWHSPSVIEMKINQMHYLFNLQTMKSEQK